MLGLVTGCAAEKSGAPAGTGSHRTIQSVLDAQSQALLDGDEAGFVADVDRAQPNLVARYRDLFATLRALRISGWRVTVSGMDGAVPLQAPDHPIDVTVGYCFGTNECPTGLPGAGAIARAATRMSFAVSDDHIVINGLVPVATQSPSLKQSPAIRPLGPAPWQLSSLLAISGPRTVVATTQALRERLPAALAAAEAAAVVADQYAFWLTPERYTVYLAGPDEWSGWFGPPDGIEVGRSVTTGPRSMDIVVRADQLPDDGLESLLRKEMGRVVTHTGVGPYATSPDGQWVSQGIAELIRYAGEPPSSVDAAVASLRAYLLTLSSIDTLLDTGRPLEPVARAAFSAASYLAISYISYRFGPEMLFQFVAAVLRGPMPVPRAAAQVLGVSWADLESEFWYSVASLE